MGRLSDVCGVDVSLKIFLKLRFDGVSQMWWIWSALFILASICDQGKELVGVVVMLLIVSHGLTLFLKLTCSCAVLHRF